MIKDFEDEEMTQEVKTMAINGIQTIHKENLVLGFAFYVRNAALAKSPEEAASFNASLNCFREEILRRMRF